MQYAVVHMGSQHALHIVQIYGHAVGASKDDDNEKLVMAAMMWLRSLGDVPSIMVGDLNLVVHGSVVEPPLAMSGRHDVLAHAGATRLPTFCWPTGRRLRMLRRRVSAGTSGLPRTRRWSSSSAAVSDVHRCSRCTH